VLLLDEPLAALDPQLRKALRGDLGRLLRQSGVTSFLVTHDQSEALAMADKVAVMRAGKIQQFTSPHELWTKPATAFVAEFVGSAAVVNATWVGDSEVELAPGLKAHLGSRRNGQQTVEVAVRATDLTRNPDGVDFEVLTAEFAGDNWLLFGEVSGGPRMSILTQEDAAVGSTIKVAVKAGQTLTQVGK
jgi:ABC-type Fe3+/spermidine/putrescine transport system ATPase subunit